MRDFRRNLARLLTQSQQMALDATCMPDNSMTIDDDDEKTTVAEAEVMQSAAASPLPALTEEGTFHPARRFLHIGAIVLGLVILVMLVRSTGNHFTKTKSGFSLPKELTISQKRGSVTFRWSNLGDAHFAELRLADKSTPWQTVKLGGQ